MKQFFTLLFVLLIFCDAGFSQSKTRYSYLTVTLRERHDWLTDERYLELEADLNIPKLSVIDSLVNYKTRAKTNTGAQLYYTSKDTAHVFFNYFRTVAECLEFLDDHDWQLFSILGNTSGNSGDVRTYPVYYLRKEK